MPRGDTILPMAGIGAFGDVGQARLIDAISRTAFEDEAPVAIAAVNIAMLVYLEIDARMAQRSRAIIRSATDGTCPVATDAAAGDSGHFRRRYAHAPPISRVAAAFQLAMRRMCD